MKLLIKEQKLNEQSFWASDDKSVKLPLGARTYLDSAAVEFDQLTIEQKLCYMGAALTRGLDLYDEFKEDVDRHMKDPKYGGYEDSAKYSLLKYLNYLREDSMNIIVFKEIEHISLETFTNLLADEILLRYSEYSGSNYQEFVASFTSIPVCHADIISRFGENTPNRKQTIINYTLTSQETISKTKIDKDYILHLNIWYKLACKLTGENLYFDNDLIYPGDEEFIYDYNSKNKHPETKLITRIPPEPWSENILNAKLVILSLNPGYVEYLNKTLANMFSPKIVEGILNDKKRILYMDGNNCDPSEASRILGDYYWYKKLSGLGTAVHGEKNKEKIFSQVAICQYLAYASSKSPEMKKILPSQKYTRMVIMYLATSRKDVKFLILRSWKKWKKLLGDGLWNHLVENDRLLISKHYRNQNISENNTGAENYQKMIELLGKN